MSVSINGTGGLTFSDSSVQSTAATGFGFKNRLINSDMRIDQRNAGSSVTNVVGGVYTIDRWRVYGSQASKFTVQRNAGSVTPPSGFTNYLGITSSSSYTVGSGEEFEVYQSIEGLNCADLDFGLATAKTVTVSFWVRSSLTGTFGGSLQNSAVSRSYVFSYTISAANTWEQKTVTIAGDTSGTWLKDTGTGMTLVFGLGQGSSMSTTAGSWVTGNYNNVTGATSVVGTSGATFYITGVQLEKGSTATSFDYRPYGTELALCQRYFETSYPAGTAVGTNIGSDVNSYSMLASTSNSLGYSSTIAYKVTKRAIPTFTPYNRSGTSGQMYWGVYGVNETTINTVINQTNVNGCSVYATSTPNANTNGVYGQWTASAEL